ncbi:endonuclease/exonuclease/phosphatase family protein [Nocardia flavorosea]|uniref:endonuclease/exonuclease/phosphatase family protein n=1 Tax=Nocardia flavorosea TaxID=53429 RepID=UPI003CC806EF
MPACDHVRMTGPTSVQRMRVATFNVLTPLLADWPVRRRIVAARIEAAHPDIIALQEVDASPDRDEAGLHADHDPVASRDDEGHNHWGASRLTLKWGLSGARSVSDLGLCSG